MNPASCGQGRLRSDDIRSRSDQPGHLLDACFGPTQGGSSNASCRRGSFVFFITASVRFRKRLSALADAGSLARLCNSSVVRYGQMACFAAAISWKLGRQVTFDPKAERFVNDADADRVRSYERRAPYTI